MTGFIFTCEERSVINDTSTCDLTMDFDVSLFEWPESASELQAKLFEFKQAIIFFYSREHLDCYSMSTNLVFWCSTTNF